MQNTKSRTFILVEGALMVALAFVLSFIPIFRLPLGGSITLCSTLPIIVFSLRNGFKWSLLVALVYGFLQMFQGFGNVLYMKTFLTMVLCAMLDYILAYACVALAGPIARALKGGRVGLIVAVVSTGVLRFACSFLSGVLVWHEYVPDGYTVVGWSAYYNGSWALWDTVVVLVGALAISFIPQLGIAKKNQPETAEG